MTKEEAQVEIQSLGTWLTKSCRPQSILPSSCATEPCRGARCRAPESQASRESPLDARDPLSNS